MILLITPSARGQECAQALLTTTTQNTHVASTLQAAVAKLREQEYSAVVIDQCVIEAEPDEGEVMLQHLAAAFPVYVNCAISGIERVVREVRSALSRRVREEQIARVSATRVIWSELKESVTAILLSCDLVLASKDVPASMVGKIQVIHDLATRMRGTLAPSEQCDPTN
jgi:DNA-binding NtrC family response regulator